MNNDYPGHARRKEHDPTAALYRCPEKLAGTLLICIAGFALAPSAAAVGEYANSAFSECPSSAFLTQGSVPKTFAVNLVTGNYSLATTDHGTTKTLNALGFNPQDRFLYGWSSEFEGPVRVHNDWQIEPLNVDNIKTRGFYVGDVNPENNRYYIYRHTAGYGLFSIGLDPSQDDYLQMHRISQGNERGIKIADMAFHPTSGMIYAVEQAGDLYEIDPGNGNARWLADVGTGKNGNFGAAYFDPDGNLYIGRNRDGKIFRIAIDSGDYTAELFANGPASNTNDGARCASAPLDDSALANIDYGDAPDSYGTTMASNGARHGLTANPALFLGTGVDGESDASAYPLSDNGQGASPDEDGVQFVTPVVGREYAIANVTASAAGYLSAWVDVDRDGRFDDRDAVLADHPLEAGEQGVYLSIPDGVSPGDTWSRFRFSSQPGMQATGGVADGEVEDYPVTVSANPVEISNYPSPTGWATIAFEDNWPYVGDYDFNDLVFYLRSALHTSAAGIEKIELSGELAAVGAEYHNGFGVRLPGVARDEIDESQLEFTINGRKMELSPLEADAEEAIFIIVDDVFDYAGSGNHCDYYRTEPGCGSAIDLSFALSIPFVTPSSQDLKGIFDPFLFATPDSWHGAHFSEPPGRGYEIHLKNQAPTEKFNPALFASIGQDTSSPDDGRYYQTEAGLPWALVLGSRWNYPVEYTDVSVAYPEFQLFSSTAGNQGHDWFTSENAVEPEIFQD